MRPRSLGAAAAVGACGSAALSMLNPTSALANTQPNDSGPLGTTSCHLYVGPPNKIPTDHFDWEGYVTLGCTSGNGQFDVAASIVKRASNGSLSTLSSTVLHLNTASGPGNTPSDFVSWNGNCGTYHGNFDIKTLATPTTNTSVGAYSTPWVPITC
ncbi:hypothetical protein [Pseudofrankia asymbiotica]|uniref:hypothetical protein n=1 Tax=Pseudofrankia asymbiotica TaxID=1834516 RepID=UPI001056DCFC|nr:hypothetical protein [Pseudofrankia asymbiotica]